MKALILWASLLVAGPIIAIDYAEEWQFSHPSTIDQKVG